MPGYRDQEPHCHHQAPNVCDLTNETSIKVLNGSTTEILIPCNYNQDEVLTPIHLRAEGYADPAVAQDRAVDGLCFGAWIDATDDHIIHLVISANCVDAVDENVELDISMLITRTDDDGSHFTDVVLHGPLTIEAAPFLKDAGPFYFGDVAEEQRAIFAQLYPQGMVVGELNAEVDRGRIWFNDGIVVLGGTFLKMPPSLSLLPPAGQSQIVFRWTEADRSIVLTTIAQGAVPADTEEVRELVVGSASRTWNDFTQQWVLNFVLA